MIDPAVQFATSRRLMLWAVRILRALAFLWQAFLVTMLIRGLRGEIDPLPMADEWESFYAYLALVVAVAVGVLVLLPYGGNGERQLGVLGRAMWWQAGVGSAFVFSIALASDDEREVLAAATVGVYLLLPVAAAAASQLLAEALAHHRTLDERYRRHVEAQRILAELAELRSQVERLAGAAQPSLLERIAVAVTGLSRGSRPRP